VKSVSILAPPIVKRFERNTLDFSPILRLRERTFTCGDAPQAVSNGVFSRWLDDERTLRGLIQLACFGGEALTLFIAACTPSCAH
jgi:hypothetical protein